MHFRNEKAGEDALALMFFSKRIAEDHGLGLRTFSFGKIRKKWMCDKGKRKGVVDQRGNYIYIYAH